MARGLILFLALALLAAPGSFLSSFENPPSPWLTEVDQAFAAARKTGKPIFAVILCFH